MNLPKPQIIDTPLKWWSVHLSALLTIGAFAYDYLGAVREYLPAGAFKWVALAVLVARVIKQEAPNESSSN